MNDRSSISTEVVICLINIMSLKIASLPVACAMWIMALYMEWSSKA